MKAESEAVPSTPCLPPCVFEEERLDVLRGISDPWAGLRKRLGFLMGYFRTYTPLSVMWQKQGSVQEPALIKCMSLHHQTFLFIPPRPSPHVTVVCLYSSGLYISITCSLVDVQAARTELSLFTCSLHKQSESWREKEEYRPILKMNSLLIRLGLR